jgi:DNA-binding GntR family transcriptional regulator
MNDPKLLPFQDFTSAESESVPIGLFPTLAPAEGNSIPLHVGIYDAIYHLISSGSIREGQLMPGENAFASHWKVSRGTVRQALRHLEEDGLVHKTQGKGTVVSALAHRQRLGLQGFSNPCTDYCSELIDRVEIRWVYEGAGYWMTQSFGLSTGSLLLVADLQYYSGVNQCAASRCLMPASLLERFGTDATDESAVRCLLLDTLFQKASRTQTSLFVLTDPKEEDSPFLTEVPLLFLEELIFDEQDRPMAFFKHYLRSDLYRLSLTRRQRGGL